MFSLILTIICVVLVAALALATIHYSGWFDTGIATNRGKHYGPLPRGGFKSWQ